MTPGTKPSMPVVLMVRHTGLRIRVKHGHVLKDIISNGVKELILILRIRIKYLL